jgi:hypothetical protein
MRALRPLPLRAGGPRSGGAGGASIHDSLRDLSILSIASKSSRTQHGADSTREQFYVLYIAARPGEPAGGQRTPSVPGGTSTSMRTRHSQRVSACTTPASTLKIESSFNTRESKSEQEPGAGLLTADLQKGTVWC